MAKQNADFIFGYHSVKKALDNHKNIYKILVKKNIKNEALSTIMSIAKSRSIIIQYVPIEKLNRLTRKNHQGIIAHLSPIDYGHIENIIPHLYELGKIPLILILDRITDVRNLGAIARNAECLGVDAIIIPNKNSAHVTSDAVKTSSGALLNIPVCMASNLVETIDFLQSSGLNVIGCNEKTSTPIHQINFKTPLAIVVGNEETGIQPSILKQCDDLATIPLLGEIQSLNVSVASSIILYEVSKQRS